jgi:hypothetical protein
VVVAVLDPVQTLSHRVMKVLEVPPRHRAVHTVPPRYDIRPVRFHQPVMFRLRTFNRPVSAFDHRRV